MEVMLQTTDLFPYHNVIRPNPSLACVRVRLALHDGPHADVQLRDGGARRGTGFRIGCRGLGGRGGFGIGRTLGSRGTVGGL